MSEWVSIRGENGRLKPGNSISHGGRWDSISCLGDVSIIFSPFQFHCRPSSSRVSTFSLASFYSLTRASPAASLPTSTNDESLPSYSPSSAEIHLTLSLSRHSYSSHPSHYPHSSTPNFACSFLHPPTSIPTTRRTRIQP
ncbi:hypothetical protein BJV78DRAFT_881328 [Lactifluus subvellereus]|nr:hypothetical protein BJV78DRAFT_881328 [Lactifluus subvellereus]